MATAVQTSAAADLDFLLEKIVEDLQLTPTQYQDAAEKYRAISNWLQAPESPLASMGPIIYPQGSMALQTTVRPRGREEYDLDAVCELQTRLSSAMELYELLYARLQANGHYRPILERLKRCVRLNYAAQFHLDVIPGRPDDMRPRPCIVVPDRALKDWTPSNPRGFVSWFEGRAEQVELVRAAQPLPDQEAPGDKAPLTVAVQLIKRRRDIMFNGDDVAPRSILLTTLAGHIYGGEEHVAAATLRILAGIDQAIAQAAPRRLDVRNPTNRDESFSESFTDASYDAFCQFISKFRGELAELIRNQGGFPALQRKLAAMFGDAPVSKAIRQFGERVKTLRGVGIQFGAASGVAVVGSAHPTSRPVPRNRFFGD
jgi:hypothetical protein